MCKLFVGVKRPGENAEFRQLLEAQFDGMLTQRDGIGALIIDKDGEASVLRSVSVEDYRGIMQAVLDASDDARFIGLHTRIATTGRATLANCHFFKENGHWFAHNGMVTKYGGYNRGKPALYLGYQNDRRFGLQPSIPSLMTKPVKLGKKARKKLKEDGNDEAVRMMDNMTKWQRLIDGCPKCQKLEGVACKSHEPVWHNLCDLYNEMDARTTPDATGTPPAWVGGFSLTRAIEIVDNCVLCVAGSCQIGNHVRINEELEKYDLETLREEEGEPDLPPATDGTGLGTDTTDSQEFMRHVKHPVSPRSIEAEVEASGFHGMAVAVDAETHEAHLIVKKKAYVMQGEGYAAFLSFEPDRKLTQYGVGTVAGVQYEQTLPDIRITTPQATIWEGVYRMEPIA